MPEPTGEIPAQPTVVPEAGESKLIVPPDFVPARTEEVTPTRFGQTESYPPRTGNVDLNLTPEQTAAKLAEQEANQRMVQAAADAAKEAAANSDAAKNRPL